MPGQKIQKQSNHTPSHPNVTKVYNPQYKGRNFRSRLEARWAAFFDICEWKYEYEPLDLKGWFPDFGLYGDKGNMILVEVKPVTKFPDDVANKMAKAAWKHLSRPSEKYDWLDDIPSDLDHDDELLILGQGPFMDDTNSNLMCVGWLCDGSWEAAWWGKWKDSSKPGFCHSMIS